MRGLVYLSFALLVLGSYGTARAGATKYERTIESFDIPDVILVNQDGERVRLKRLLESADKPVVVDYIYGTCTTICPVLSATFASVQRKLGAQTEAVRLVSISIDPENDTPKVMKEYLKRYGAKPGWDFLSGTRADINQVMRAFDAYMPDKMSHLPLNFIRIPDSGRWVRLYGLMGSRDLMAEYEKAGSR